MFTTVTSQLVINFEVPKIIITNQLSIDHHAVLAYYFFKKIAQSKACFRQKEKRKKIAKKKGQGQGKEKGNESKKERDKPERQTAKQRRKGVNQGDVKDQLNKTEMVIKSVLGFLLFNFYQF